MRSLTLALALAAATALSGCGKGDDSAATSTAPVATIAAPAGTDWRETVAVSPAGGFVMGNPNAPVKLIEYASVTCPHCAEFSEKGAPTIRDSYVKSGQLSWEFRPFLLNAIDAPVSILARCQGPLPFFKLIEQLYANQSVWIAGFQGLTPADQARLQGMAPAQAMREIVKLGKVDGFFRQRGLPEAKIDACLADPAAAATLEKLRAQGESDGVTGTPMFLVNGTLQNDVFSWETLEPKLKAAVAG